MPNTGSGSMTPVAGGAGTGLHLAQPLPYTLLAPARYARIMGITPPHLFMAHAPNVVPSPVWPISTCAGVWPRHAWQNYDQLSLEDVVLAIKQAEDELARAVGYYAAPMWFTEEPHEFPRDFYRDSLYQIYDVRGLPKGVNTSWARIVAAGTRAVTLLGTVTTAGGSLAYTDEDGDGFFDTATITLAGMPAAATPATTKIYFTGKNGAQEWEIRPERAKSISVGGVFTATFDSWLFIDPDLQSVYPTDAGFAAVDISTVANFVTSVEVRREFNDPTDVTAQFVWEPTSSTGYCTCCNGAGCTACTLTTQDGCMHVRDGEVGIAVPTPATYAAGAWSAASFDVCRAPDQVKLWYQAGELSEEFKAGRTYDPLSDFWAWTIAMLATARLQKAPCSCANVKQRFQYWQEDLSKAEGGISYFSGRDVTDLPYFGPARGEILAYRRLKNLVKKRRIAAII